MQVTLEYAEAHLAELLDAAQGGQEVEIERPGKPSFRLVTADPGPSTEVRKRRGLVGSAKGQIWMADDWDSPETNAEIAALFNDGPVFPDETQ